MEVGSHCTQHSQGGLKRQPYYQVAPVCEVRVEGREVGEGVRGREKEMERKGEVGDGGIKRVTYVTMVTMQLE